MKCFVFSSNLLMFLDVMLTDICSSKYVESAKTPVYEFQSDTVLRAYRSPLKQQHQPSRIEDYEPGRCSLAVRNGVEVSKLAARIIDYPRSGVVVILVVSVCIYVCQTITFESLDVGIAHLHVRYISTDYTGRVRI